MKKQVQTHCDFCGKRIDGKRLYSARGYKYHFRRYCSKACIKRGWYIRNQKRKVHTILEGPNLQSCTGKGLYWEVHAQKLLGGRVMALESMNQPHDIILDDGTLIDVKSSNIHRRKNSEWWAFHGGNNSPDYYFCIGLREDTPERYFLIPCAVMPRVGASVPTSNAISKYYTYEYSLPA